MLRFACHPCVLQHVKACGFLSFCQARSRVVKPGERKSRAADWFRSTSFSALATQDNAHVPLGQPKQVPLNVVRRKEGWGVYSPAGARFNLVVNTTENLVHEPTEEEKQLASQLKAAGNRKNRQWQAVFSKYSGSSPWVLTAAMQAALKTKDYEEGFQVYKRVRHMTLPTYTISMKLLGKLGQLDEVERLWDQLVQQNAVGQEQAGGRIDAAADNGDIQAAVRVLDYMKGKGIEAKALHFGSAINACANSKDANRAEVAQGFFDEMLRTGLTPTIVTYATVLRAFKHEPRERLLNLLVDMKDQNVRANAVFAETFLFIFLKKPPEKGCWTAQSVIASDLRKLRLADLQTAKDFIDELKHTNVNLNKSCRLIDEAIQSVLQEAHSVMGQSV